MFLLLLFLVLVLLISVNGLNKNKEEETFLLKHDPTPIEGIERIRIQEGAFRMLQSNIYRQYVNYTHNNVPYLWADFYGSTLGLLDLFLSLQLDLECQSQLITLYNTVSAQVQRPQDESNWWRDVFFIQSVEAFSCGYDDENPTNTPHHMLPSDIKNLFDNDIIIRKTWRLMEGYNGFGNSCGKMTEAYERHEDTDLSFYVALLDRRVGTSYLQDGLMRAGAPWYVGTPMWLMFHTIVNRIYDFPQSEQSNLALKFKTFFDFFAWHHPCPDCRHHLLFKVMLNDVDNTPNGSESNLYPLEWLYISGDDRSNANQDGKLNTIVDADSANLFVFHIHNAINSAITSKVTCRYQERYDLEISGNEGFRCGIYPWAKRYERAFGQIGEFEYMREYSRMELLNLEDLDRADARGSYWVQGITPSDWEQYYPLLEDGIANVSNSVISSGFLQRAYSLNSRKVDLDVYNQMKLDVNLNSSSLLLSSIQSNPERIENHSLFLKLQKDLKLFSNQIQTINKNECSS